MSCGSRRGISRRIAGRLLNAPRAAARAAKRASPEGFNQRTLATNVDNHVTIARQLRFHARGALRGTPPRAVGDSSRHRVEVFQSTEHVSHLRLAIWGH